MSNAAKIEDGLRPILDGEITPASAEGRAILEAAMRQSPEVALDRLDNLDRELLDRTMRAAGIDRERADELLDRHKGEEKTEIDDPFAAGATAVADAAARDPLPEVPGDDEPSPFEIDPSDQIRRGPRPV